MESIYVELILKEQELDSMKELRDQYVKERHDLSKREGIAKCMSRSEIDYALTRLNISIRDLTRSISNTETEIKKLKEEVD